METLPPILCSSVESSVPVTPHGCHCSPSPSARHTYSSFSHSLSNLAASRCRPTPAQRGERRRDTRVPFCYQIRWNNDSPPPSTPSAFRMHESQDKIRNFHFGGRFPWSGCNANAALYKYGGKSTFEGTKLDWKCWDWTLLPHGPIGILILILIVLWPEIFNQKWMLQKVLPCLLFISG